MRRRRRPAAAGAPGPGLRAARGTLRRFRNFRWDGVEVEPYAAAGDGADWAGISRQVLVAGSRGARTAFDVRYFEIAAGGWSRLEHHEHAHVIIGVRGEGRVRIGRRWLRLGRLDACYIGPHAAHRLRNAGRKPFGFFCLVDAERDRPRAVPAQHAVTRPGRSSKKGDP